MTNFPASKAFRQVPPERQNAWMIFLQAYKVVMDEVEDALASELDLTLPEFEVLAWLYYREDGRMRMQDVAEMLLLSKGRVSRLVAGLEEDGCVRREVFDADRRGVFAVITEKGAALFEEAAPVFVQAYNRTFSRHLSDNDVEQMNALMHKIVAGNGRIEFIRPCDDLHLGETTEQPVAASAKA
jgi:DNA-binding MarR family transcriptional regulator